MRNKILLGTLVVFSIFLIYIFGKTENKEFIELESRKTSNLNVDKTDGKKAVDLEIYKEIIDGELVYDDIKYEDGRLIIKYHVLDLKDDSLEGDMEVVEEEFVRKEGTIIGTLLNIDKKSYVKIDKNYMIVNEDGQLEFRSQFNSGTIFKYNVKGIDVEVLENGKLQFLGESKATIDNNIMDFDDKYNKFFESDRYEDFIINKEPISEKMNIELKKEINREYNGDFSILEYDSMVYGTDGKVRVIDFIDENTNTIIKVLINLENNKIVKINPELDRIADVFFHEEELMGIGKDGELISLEVDNDKIKVKDRYESEIIFNNEKGFKIIYKDNSYIYVEYMPIYFDDENGKIKLYSFDLNTKKAKLIGESNDRDRPLVLGQAFKGKIIVRTELETFEYSIGRLNGDKVDILIEDIPKSKSVEAFYGEDNVILKVLHYDDRYSEILKTEIYVYELKEGD